MGQQDGLIIFAVADCCSNRKVRGVLAKPGIGFGIFLIPIDSLRIELVHNIALGFGPTSASYTIFGSVIFGIGVFAFVKRGS